MKKILTCLFIISILLLLSCGLSNGNYLPVYGSGDYLSISDMFTAKEMVSFGDTKLSYIDISVPKEVTENIFGKDVVLYYDETIYKGKDGGWLHDYSTDLLKQVVQYSVDTNEIIFICDYEMCHLRGNEFKITDEEAIKIAYEFAKTKWDFIIENDYNVMVVVRQFEIKVYFNKTLNGFITNDFASVFMTYYGEICGWTYCLDNGKELEGFETEIQNIDVEKCKKSIERFITEKSDVMSEKNYVITGFDKPWIVASKDGTLYCQINTYVTLNGYNDKLPMYVEIATDLSKE